MLINYLLILLLSLSPSLKSYYSLPVYTVNRRSISTLAITEIGGFGLVRKARPGIPAHYHTGIDIKRPAINYHDEPIFPIIAGIVISKRQDGPYAQLIIQHENPAFWTVYEHIAGIKVNLNDHVSPDSPVARFMNRTELNRYGWQFDHFHLEILKIQPIRLKVDPLNPDRKFSSYTLVCYTKEELNKYFYNPLDFMQNKFNNQ
jgi:murein DD-endopeptidase MepM/ murein hydrolase activator NlpD